MTPLSTVIADLTDNEFRTIAQYIENTVGIKMPDTKRIMMQSRLAPRLRKLGFGTYREYIQYVFEKDAAQEELVLMIDALTTNKTEFFREADHFTYLSKTALPEFVAAGKRDIRIWSAGCSSGEEVYTLGMVLSEYSRQHPGDISTFKIIGSDISTKVLDKAYNAIYDMNIIEDLPLDLKKRYFLKGKGEPPLVRVKPELRSNVSFRRLNFMDDSFDMPCTFEVIFCRNVLIYFDKPTQEQVIRKFMRYLEPNGFLFLGHSETLLATDLPLKSVAPTAYKKVL